MNRIEQVFGMSRVLLPVIHPISRDEALESIRIVHGAGVKGIFLIDQGMDEAAVLQLVMEVRAHFPALWVGVNLLRRHPADALELALDTCAGRIDGIWSDSARIDERTSAQPEAEELVAARRTRGWSGLYFGGVAFKYQRAIAFADLGRTAAVAASYMDVVCTSGPGTGQAADVEKLGAMRGALGETALALASGVTAANVGAYLPYAQAFLVGTGIEARFGVIDEAKVTALLHAMKSA
jgi:predicted TIM-barrel enzyme